MYTCQYTLLFQNYPKLLTSDRIFTILKYVFFTQIHSPISLSNKIISSLPSLENTAHGGAVVNVESYSFGSIIIDGKTYDSDVIIHADRVDARWWRREGHSLCMEDLRDALQPSPDVIVVGTGFYGVMRVPNETRESITSLGVELVAQKTGDAYKTFNQLVSSGKRVVGAFHLTC